MSRPPKISPPSDTRQTRSQAFGMGLILVSTLSFSWMALFSRMASPDFRADSLVFLRCFFQALALLPWIGRFWPDPSRRRATLQAHFLRGTVGVVAMWLLYSALAELPLAMVSLLTMTSALWASLGARVFLGEKLGVRRVLLAFGVVFGLVLILWPAEGSSAWRLAWGGVIAALLCGLCMGGAQILVREMGQRFGTLEIVFWMGVAGTVFSAPAYFSQPQIPHNLREWGLILGIGLTALGGQLSMTRGFRYTPTMQGSLCVLFGNVWNILFGLWFLNEVPPAAFWLGATIAVGAIAMLMAEGNREKVFLFKGR